MTHRKSIVWIFLVLTALLVPTAAMASRQIDEVRPAAAGGSIFIENVAGSITVVGWGRNEVHVTGTLGDHVEDVEISGSADDLHIEVKLPEGSNRKRNVDADLKISVPAGCHLAVETVSAPIELSGLDGDLEVESVSGGITASGRPRSVEASSVSGRLQIETQGAPIKAESVSGSVTLQGVGSELEVSTVSGAVTVTAGDLQRGRLESVSGEIRLDAGLASGGDLQIESHSGNVILTLPAGISAAFDVDTFAGEVDNDFGPPAERTSRYAPGKAVKFAAGSGDARVSIETFSGNVTLTKQ